MTEIIVEFEHTFKTNKVITVNIYTYIFYLPRLKNISKKLYMDALYTLENLELNISLNLYLTNDQIFKYNQGVLNHFKQRNKNDYKIETKNQLEFSVYMK